MAKGKVEIYSEACKSCLYCVVTCPKKVLSTTSAVNSKGYQYVVPVNPDACIGCAMCATICPMRQSRFTKRRAIKMSDKVFMKGCEAVAEAAVRAGCRFFAGYPITPQNDVPEYFSRRMPQVGGVFLQERAKSRPPTWRLGLLPPASGQ
jgi:NAD-dependent dihydropyrimidine dehydrogenase PreA subunit